MGEQIALIVGVTAGALVIIAFYFLCVERLLARIAHKRQRDLRPWLWLIPALIFIVVFLVYPVVNTIYLSFLNASAGEGVGFANFQYVFTNPDMLRALQNNVLWLIFFTSFTVVLGLVMAVLTDRVPYERVAKAIMFMPMAISFVAAGVIWKFMYDYRPPGQPQTGTLNALWMAVVPDAQPQAWLINPATNNLALIFAGVWMLTGFCLVILSAGLKGIPDEFLEAARVDGANEVQTFFYIIVPLLAPTLVVVTTTMIITAMKAFDIVYVLSGGNYNTDVIATRMYKELFSARNYGHASAIAVVLLLVTVPIMIANVRSFRRQDNAA